MNHVIFDIDNCIANDAWRMAFIDWRPGLNGDERYGPYHERCDEDAPANTSLLLSVVHAFDHAPVFFTARPESVRIKTEYWLYKHFGIARPVILMRGWAEFTPSVPLKRRMLEKFRARLGPGDVITAAYDDREDLVEMYRSEGLAAEVLKVHDVCPYTNPLTLEKIHG